MFQQTCIVCLLTFTCVLQESCPRSSATSSIWRCSTCSAMASQVRLYVPVLHTQFGHAYNRVSVSACTVTEEEKTALKAKLPKIGPFLI